MLTLDLVLSIIKLSLEIALEATRSMNEEQRHTFWQRHEDRVEFWRAMVVTLQQPPTPPVA